jgi:hypothetical protein
VDSGKKGVGQGDRILRREQDMERGKDIYRENKYGGGTGYR